ncbi:MAG: hypothetical protein KJI72_01380 [Patescibacteria group bacterium]|nr:hypothetical protein [Patescibacteria group bacterium]
MVIKKDRVPLKFLIFVQHGKLKANRFSTNDILKFFRDNPAYIGMMMGIGRSVPEKKIRSFLRGLPGNISMVLNAIGLVRGSDDYYYRLPEILFRPIKDGILLFRVRSDGDVEPQFTNITKVSNKKFEAFKQEVEKALQVFLDRKTQEFKLRDYDKKWPKRAVIQEISNSGRKVSQYFFEQRKACFETNKREHIYIPYPTIPYEEILKSHPRIYYSIPKSFIYHQNCPNFVFKILTDDLEYKDFYTIPFRVLDNLVFKKLEPDAANIFYFFIKPKNGEEWLYFKTGQPILPLAEYHKLNKIEDISKAPYTAPFQNARLKKYREQLHAQITSTFEDKIKLIKKYKEANQEVNVISYIENLSLAKALKVKQDKEEKIILVVRVDTAYPDLLCIYLDDLVPAERFNKSLKSLDLMDLFSIRHDIIQNVDSYKGRLFEIEAEYDAFEFSAHESPKDDITRSRFVAAWISNYPNDIYTTKKKIKIPIINVEKLWHNLIRDTQTQR